MVEEKPSLGRHHVEEVEVGGGWRVRKDKYFREKEEEAGLEDRERDFAA